MQAIISLKEVLSKIVDPRNKSGLRHPLLPILLLTLCAFMCGITSYTGVSEWGRALPQEFIEKLGFTRTPPCAATFCNVYCELDVDHLEKVLSEWAYLVIGAETCSWASSEKALSLDGKCLRGSKKQGSTSAHLVAAVSHQTGICVGQKSVDEKTNEIPVAMDLLEELVLEGWVVTADAMHTQKRFAEQLIEKGGDYILIAKGNQPELLNAVQSTFNVPELSLVARNFTEHMEKGHGRFDKREIWVSSRFNQAQTQEWEGINQVFKLTRSSVNAKTGEDRTEIVYGITSLSSGYASPERVNQLIRNHWTIENQLHWVRDYVFKEDDSLVRKKSTPQVMAAIRNTTISLIKSIGENKISKSMRIFSAQPQKALDLLGV